MSERPEHNVPVFSVGEVSQALKLTVEDAFARVRVRGEVSGFKRAGSGHLYFALKDAEAVLDAVCWRGAAGRLGLAPEDGMEVIATGRLTTYPGRSKYQMVVERLELAGEGALLKLLEERKRRLAAEGLFDPARKVPLPFLPAVVGVVTSPTGAVIRDILHRLADRFPCRVVLWPVRVQGEGAADQVAAAIGGFDALAADGPVPRPDVLIVARGGGSLEDLMAFNEETVVRAAAACTIPLIAAVGHETDVTLIDFAADVRAPTPTAAAEMAVPVRAELAVRLAETAGRLATAAARGIEARRLRLGAVARGLPDLGRLVEGRAQRLDDWGERLSNALGVGMERRQTRLAAAAGRLVRPRRALERARAALDGEARALERAGRGLLAVPTARLAHAAALLESYSYQRVLERGFVVIRDGEGGPVTAASATRPGQPLTVAFHDGEVGVVVTGGAPRPKPRTGAKTKDRRQGTLL